MSAIFTRLRIFLLALLPRRMAHSLARAWGRREAATAAPLRERMTATIAARLGLGPAEAESVTGKVFERRALERLEGGAFRLKSRRQLTDGVEIRGLEELRAAVAGGRGCVLCGAHFRGHWSFVAALGLLGYRPLLVRQRVPAEAGALFHWFQDRLERLFAAKFGCRFLWLDAPAPLVAGQATAHLRANGVLVTFVDIAAYASRVIEVDFLGRTESFPAGPMLLSKLAGAPLLGFSIRYDAAATRYVCQLRAVQAGPDVHRTMQQLASYLDAAIRAHPEDWSGWQKRQYIGA
jgi:lauroyl/myristoyl acyltransferase